MAKQVKLIAQARSAVGRSAVRKLKQQGVVPAVIYGAKHPAQSLQIAARDINTLLSHAVGENILVDLEIVDGDKKTNRMALIQEVQHQPVGGRVLHVDFQAVSMDEKIEADIPIEPIGEADGVKNYGGILEQSMRSLSIECLPKDLPDVLRVDVSALKIGDSIHVRDIKLPAGVVARASEDLTVLAVAAPIAEEEVAAPAAAEAPTEPEVIKEKKPEGAAPAAGEKEAPKAEKGEKK
jgi:large subunit ribosomal protein L25